LSIGVAQILPAVILRRAGSPERVLGLLLPAFTAVANILGPLGRSWSVGAAEPPRDRRQDTSVTERPRRRGAGARAGRAAVGVISGDARA
jgi:hypothetical protein